MLAIFFINSALIIMAVLIHYEALYQLAKLMPKLDIYRHRSRILVTVFGILCAHVVEIWLFAFGYYLMSGHAQFGQLAGNFDGSLLDCSYFSFASYTSLGIGDIHPFGPLRFLAGLEALTGVVLISWTASFLFIEMQKFWPSK
jgi:hypothetical protein